MTDLSKSFNKLIGAMFENIGGCRVERLPENKYRWGNHVGIREEIETAISEANGYIGNSIKKQKP